MPFSEDKYSLFAKYLLIYSSALAETKGKLSYYSTSVGYYDLGVCYWIYKAKKSAIHPTFPYVRNQLTPARGAIKQENLFLVLAPCCCSRGPIKALPEFLVWLQVNFYESGKVKNPDQHQNYPL